MDGVRIFNVAISLEVDVKDFSRYVDNLMFCLSKGLSCPIGSIVVGSQEFIDRVRKTRKILGGGMRLAGVIAAPGIIALEKMIERWKEDHRNVKLLAEKLNRMDEISVNLETVQTNIVHLNVNGLRVTSKKFVLKLKEKSVLSLTRGRSMVRMVAHRGIEKERIEKTISMCERVVNDMIYIKRERIRVLKGLYVE